MNKDEILKVDSESGEVFKVQFRSMWNNPFGVVGQDLSDPFLDTFIEIPPFTRDDKGNFINDTSVPKFKKTGKINVQEQIQSYADEVDIYKILEQFAATGDDSLLNRVNGFYSDISEVPTNFNDYQDYLIKNINNLDYVSKELKEKILTGESISSVDIDNEVRALARSQGFEFDENLKAIPIKNDEKKDKKESD